MPGKQAMPQGRRCQAQRAALFAALLAVLDSEPTATDAALGLLERELRTPYDDLSEKFASLRAPQASREDRLYGAMLLYLCLGEPRVWHSAVWVGPDMGGEDMQVCLRLAGELAAPELVAGLAEELSLVVKGLDPAASVDGLAEADGQARFLLRP